MRSVFHLLALILGSFGISTRAISIDRNKYIIEPKKISIGPDDSYDSNSKDGQIFFTRNSSLSKQIYRLSRNNEAYPIIPGDADSEHSAINPWGDELAFTYYKFDAKGDICLWTEQKGIQCLTDKKTSDHSPFWLAKNRLGFMTQDMGTKQWQLNSLNIETGTKNVIKKGQIAAPHASPEGRFIVFNQVLEEETRLIIFEHQKNKIKVVSFELPGQTGISKFSPDGRYLYFSHYLNDTNADQGIDGNDHSVIFKAEFDALLKNKTYVPKQLTSIESNCNFPDPGKKTLLLTCAFKGSLDLYEIPLSGVIPKDWDAAMLAEALDVSRTNGERLLVLMTLLEEQGPKVPIIEKILSNHLELNETRAAFFYVDQLIRMNHLSNFYESFKIYLEIKEAKNREQTSLISNRFKNLLAKKLKEITKIKNWPYLRGITKAYLYYVSDQKKRSLSELKKVNLKGNLKPLERFLAFNLYTKILKNLKKDIFKLIPLFESMILADHLSHQSRMYYTLALLEAIEEGIGHLKKRKDILLEIHSRMENLTHVKNLIQVELLAIEIINEKSTKKQSQIFKNLSRLYKEMKDDYFVSKAAYTRGIKVFAKFDMVYFMEKIASLWLRYTKLDSIEFFHAAQQFSYVTVDRGYQVFAEGKHELAASIFYAGIRQTNDLESHAGFSSITLNFLHDPIRYQKIYDKLEKDKIIGKNRLYAQALKMLLDLPKSGNDPDEIFSLAIEKLEAMDQRSFNESMRYLLLGYCYHEKLRLGKHGFKYDKKLLANAHRNYMLAHYIGLDNFRITAPALNNLALLHQDVGNYSLSSRYFIKREKIPFLTSEEMLAFRYHFAQSWFRSNNPKKALDQISIAINQLKLKSQLDHWRSPLTERAAFYAMHSNKFNQSIKNYRELLSLGNLSNINKVRINLGLGYSLYKSGKMKEAKKSLQKVIILSHRVSPQLPGKTKIIGTYPQRFRIIANGILAQLSSAKDAISHREQRIHDLVSLEGKEDFYRIKKEKRLAQICLDRNHQANHYLTLKKYHQAGSTMNQALRCAKDWVKNGGNVHGIVFIQTLINYMALGIQHPSIFSKFNQTQVADAVLMTQGEFESMHKPLPISIFKQTKLELFWASYKNTLKNNSENKKREMKKIMSRPQLNVVKELLPAKFQELRRYYSQI